MWALSNAIREKPDWWEKVNDNAIMGKWKQEALDQQKDLPKARALSEKMVCTLLLDFTAKTEESLLHLRSTTPSQSFLSTQGSGRKMVALRC